MGQRVRATEIGSQQVHYAGNQYRPSTNPMQPSIKTKITSGVIWSIFMRWSIKLVGFINTLILARLLTPDDFGLVAIATLLIGLLEELSTVNVSFLLIRTKASTTTHNDTAWTVNIIQSLFVAAVLLIIAPYAAIYFKEPRVIEILYILALVKVIVGFRNIGLVLARKELDFALDYRFTVYSRLATFVFVLGLSLYFRNYWGIVYGTVLGEIFSTFLSYRMHPYRPKLGTTHVKEYIRFAVPMIPLATARELNNKLDVYVIGGITNTSTMGIYNVANELPSTLIKEVILPTTRGLFPNFARLNDDRDQLNKIYIQTVSASAIYCFPAIVGIWFVANDLVATLLGDQWKEVTPFLKWLAIYAGLSSISIMMSEQSFIAMGLEKWANRVQWLRLSILAICIYIGYSLSGTVGIAQGVAFSAILSLPLVISIASTIQKIPTTLFIREMSRPVIASVVMGCVLYFESMYVPQFSLSAVNLILLTATGAVVYLLSLIVVCSLVSTEHGVETLILQKLKTLLFRKKSAGQS